jgi:hypothetical protein
VPPAASVLAGKTFSPIHPVLPRSRTYPGPTLLQVKVGCAGVFWIIMARNTLLLSKGTIFPKRWFAVSVLRLFTNQLVVMGNKTH